MRVAIIGYGYMGQMYADLAKQNNWELVGVHDIVSTTWESDIDSTTWKSDKFFHNRLALISHPQVDAVIICTPHSEHLTILKECLKQRKHVILEKPMGSSLAETEQIYKKIKKYKDTSVVVVNITHCFYDNIQEAKEILSGHDIKSITAIHDSVVFPIKKEERDLWLFKKAKVGHGVMLTNGCHLLARILYLFSEYKPKFEVKGGIFGNLNHLGDIDDSLAHMRLDLVLADQQRIPVTIFANWPMANSADEAVQESMQVRVDQGIMHIQAWKGVKFYPNPDEQVSKTVPYNRDTISPEISKGVQNVLKSFQEAVGKKQATVHHSVEYTVQAERAIATFYAQFKKHAYDTRNHSPLVQSLDCAIDQRKGLLR